MSFICILNSHFLFISIQTIQVIIRNTFESIFHKGIRQKPSGFIFIKVLSKNNSLIKDHFSHQHDKVKK